MNRSYGKNKSSRNKRTGNQGSRIRKVRLQDGRCAMIEVSKVPSPYIQASIEDNGVYGGWGPLSKSKIEKDSNGYKAA